MKRRAGTGAENETHRPAEPRLLKWRPLLQLARAAATLLKVDFLGQASETMTNTLASAAIPVAAQLTSVSDG